MAQPSLMPAWSDMDRASERLYETGQDPSSLLPPAYTFITTAGSGTYGDVYFCLPTSAIILARTDLTDSTEHSIICDKLTKQLVAIKICQGTGIPTLHNEIKTLQAINTTDRTAQAAVYGYFFAILDHGPCLNSTARYLTTSTLPLVCPLSALRKNFPSLPEVFTWLIYTNLAAALRWLTDTCPSGIAHGDLHLANILVGYSSLPQSSEAQVESRVLPEVKLIDFGHSLLRNAQPGAEHAFRYSQAGMRDQTAFLHVMAEMLGVEFDRRGPSARWSHGGSLEGRSEEWGQFRMCVEKAVKGGSWDHEYWPREMEERWGRFAESEVEHVWQDDVEKVLEAVVVATEEQRGNVRAKIEELINAD